jgi:glucose uptake protein
MFCWGSWANTQKLAGKEWRFQLFYWDYSIGVLLFALLLAFTMGSVGETGRAFLDDVAQADTKWVESAFLGGVIFNASNILLVAAIDVAGLAVAFPIGVGLALVLGIITTYFATRSGNAPMLAAGVVAIMVAIIIDAIAYRRLAHASRGLSVRGIALSIVAGVLMGGFYSRVAQSIGNIDLLTNELAPGKLSPYTAVVFFSFGLFLSSFVWNGVAMRKPFHGEPIAYRDYFTKGNTRLHCFGILGGVIWNIGMGLNIIASTKAGPALSYGLGQGATMIGAVWGVFVWREFKGAPRGTNLLLAAMFLCYLLGLGILVASKL